MRFTIVYEGDLPPTGNASDKRRIREEIAPQFEKLWTDPLLAPFDQFQNKENANHDWYFGKSVRGTEYVPLISDKQSLRCELDILLLSSMKPGGVLNCGDIDNRLKTLLDALSVPNESMEKSARSQSESKRVYCLLDDDKLVTRVNVTNDRLLSVQEHDRKALAIINVKIVPAKVTIDNIGLLI